MRRSTKIKDFPRIKRPRERLAAVGIQNLTKVELLAIILSSGTKHGNVLSLARKILKTFPLKELSGIQISDLTKIKGVGQVKAGKILASLELGGRAVGGSVKQLLTPQDVLGEVDDIKSKNREYLVALYLNARHNLLKKQTISIGNLNQSFLEPRDVFAPALILPCSFIILAHNHPSGDSSPSMDDKTLTKHLFKAGELLGIKLVDHIIVSKNDYFSFKEAKLL